MKILNKILTTFLAIALSVAALVAQTPEERGLQIAQEADLRDEGFDDTKSDLTMILRNRHGQESTRYMRNKTLEVTGDGDKSMIIFDSPRDVKALFPILCPSQSALVSGGSQAEKSMSGFLQFLA